MIRNLIMFAFIGLLQQSCSIISFTHSLKREPVKQSIQLSSDFKLSSTGAVYMNLAGIIKADFFPASFKIEFQEKLIYIDPIVVDDTAAADYIFITHAHEDHLSLPDIEKLMKKETVIVGPKAVVKKLSDYSVKLVKPGDRLDFGNIKCEAVGAYNIKKGFFKMTLHKKSHMNVGYILSFDSIRVYHAGDTDFIPEMKGFSDITIAMVPIGEGHTAMNPEQAATAINVIKPLIAVPMHYEIGKNSAYIFKSLVNKEIQVEIIQQKE